MSTPQESAFEQFKKMGFGTPERRRGTETHYANGKPRVAGKTQTQIKMEKKAYKPVITHYKTDTSNAPPQKRDRWGWAGRVGQAHLRNQKAEHEHGYREGYA